MNISIVYEHLGLEILFHSKSWEERNVVIDQVVLFERG